MKVFKNQNVYEAALDRIRYLFDEFPNVVVAFSGGKDSTVILNMALKVAEEKNRLPISVVFIDQEAEWQNVINYVEDIMYDKRVIPYWLQIPIKLFNSTSTTEEWLITWEQGKKWMREQNPISIKENKYDTDRFSKLFDKVIEVEFNDKKTALLGGVRAEESPRRALAMTQQATYQDITYGKVFNKKLEHYVFYPLYDWSYTDIWKAIHDNNWKYCKIYDYMYQYGYSILDMRVSNLHHETAFKQLFFLQEIEADTWVKLTDRIKGINTAGQMKGEAFRIKEIPYMFSSWVEYRNYLCDNLISDETIKEKFYKYFKKIDATYKHKWIMDRANKVCVNAILSNDYHSTTIDNFERNGEAQGYRRFLKGTVNPLYYNYYKAKNEAD